MSHAAKAWSFLAALSLVLIILGHAALGREGLLIGLMLSLGINCYVYFFEDQRIVKLFRGQILEGQDPWGVLTKTRRLAARMRLPIPRVIVLNNKSPQSLVVGRSLNQGTIILTEGLFEKLSPEETDAVIAYSLACIKNLNTLAFAVASFLAHIILFLTGLLDSAFRLMLVEKKRPDQSLSQIFTRLASPFVGLLIRLAVRPSAYLKADQMAAENIEDPKFLASALWKLNSYSHTLPTVSRLALSHMYIVNPLTQFSWNRYYCAQPSVENRVRNIVGYYPL